MKGYSSRLLTAPLILAPLLLPGCAALNDSLVRFRFEDRNLSGQINSRIREGLQRRDSAPAPELPKRPAPAFLDQG